MSEISEALQATSNVIELKPGHKYLLVFKNSPYGLDALDHLHKMFQEWGVDCFSLALSEDSDLQVIEIPEKK